MPRLPRLEDFETPEAWNADCEEMMSTLSSPILPTVCFEMELGLVQGRSISIELLRNQVDREELCDLQRVITRECLIHFGRRKLEAKWMAASPDVRQQHLLIALAKACSLRWYLNDPRSYCPHELSDWNTSTPIYISNPVWDKFAAEKNASNLTNVEKYVFEKNHGHVLQITMHSFLGIEPPSNVVSRSDKAAMAAGWAKAEELLRPALEEALGHEGAKMFLKVGKKTIPRLSSSPRREHHCSYPCCQRVESSDNSIRFDQCKACSEKAQREVRYCSVECQRKDWKPRHKIMCGKPLDIATVSKSTLALQSAAFSNQEVCMHM
ncbi:hypothetical protein C8R43DRAFT_1111829 [Mycena crocata]|nr:hypothetical protein C8R43DRAFT_1111829 [Mycena crocata]